MLDEQSNSLHRSGQQKSNYELDSELNIIDEVHFFYANRSKLTAYFSLLVLVGLSGLLVWRLSRPLEVQGRVILNFKGIEKGEYPDGRKFNVQDLRSPDIVGMALMDAKIAKDRTAANKLSVDVEIKPIISRRIEMGWVKQDKDGVQRGEYFPNEFGITIHWTDFPRDAGLHFFEALVKRYQERAKAEQMSALRIARSASQSSYYTNLLQDLNYDYEDVLRVLDSSAGSLSACLSRVLSSEPDLTLRAGFQDIQREITVWSATHLETLKAMTSGVGIVKNKDTAAARLRYRLNDCNMQIRQKTGELAETFKLLAAVSKPQPLLIGQSGKEATTRADSAVLERLIASDYVAPLVKRISDLQHETKALETEKMRLEKDAGLIAQARSVAPGSLPASYQRAITVASTEFESIINSYNGMVDRYLTSTTANCIRINNGPAIVREGPAMRTMLAFLVLISGLVALVWVRLKAALRAAPAEACSHVPQLRDGLSANSESPISARQ